MTEAIFPLLGVALVVLIALPLSSLLAKGCISLLDRSRGGNQFGGLNRQFLLIACSSALPLAWFFSAGLHQAETSKSVIGCLLGHDDAELCFEAGFFALNLGLFIVVQCWRVIRRVRRVLSSFSPAARDVERRIEHLVKSHSVLSSLAGSVIVTDEPEATIGTQGWTKPQVFIGVAFAECLSDEMLAAALAHECEHVRSRDPLRYLLLQLALAVNPVGRFVLEPLAARWHATREAQCDRAAVVGGSSPLSLADAIVQAARPRACRVPALGPSDTAVLKFRIELLLAFSERRPDHYAPKASSSTLPSAFALVLVALLLPHQASTAPLDILHMATEHVLILL